MDFNDYPSTQHNIAWKPVVLIAGGVVILIVATILIIRFVSGDENQVNLARTVQEQAQETVANCDSAVNPEGCRRQKVTTVAAQTGFEETCELLETVEERDNCYWGVARVSADASVCAKQVDSEKATRCADGVYLAQALAQKDAAACEQIVEQDRKDRCLALFAPQAPSQDTDADGLTDDEEQVYDTDPNNPDSDGDSYSDGQEVSGGYNPLGPGLLL